MCGISFVLDPTGQSDAATLASRLHEPIRHRGPDAEAFLTVDRSGAFDVGPALHGSTTTIAAAGFRRLKIVDLSDEAMQPMVAADRSAALLFNGEIYNFKMLRSDLQARGHVFRTSGDSEVILAAYQEWGEGCFTHLDGMWAIVIIDFRRRRVVGSRDRFGMKPLHWTRHRGALLLASEARQIVRAMGVRPRANDERVATHVRGGRYPVTDETFFRDIHCVPPATSFAAEFDDEPDLVFQPYWRLSDIQTNDAIGFGEAADRFEELFHGAVRSHHGADVAIGSLLSGGLDSSMITSELATIGRREGRKFPAFSFGFRDEYREFSELEYVDAMVRQESLEHFETAFDARWISANVARVVESIEEPPLALPVLAQYRTFQLCRDHGITVVLDGQGADEILAGYPYHQRIATTEMLRQGRLGTFVREMRAIATRNDVSFAGQCAEFYLMPLQRRLAREESVLNASYSEAARPAAIDVSRSESAVERRLYFDLRWGNAKIILQYADRNAMAHAIEARVPFFDRALVEFAFSLPSEYKVGAGDRKRIQRVVARRRIPRMITERSDRMGFGTPDIPMIRGPLRAQILEALGDPSLATQPFLDATQLARLMKRFEDGDDLAVRPVWRLFTLALWARAFDVVFG